MVPFQLRKSHMAAIANVTAFRPTISALLFDNKYKQVALLSQRSRAMLRVCQ